MDFLTAADADIAGLKQDFAKNLRQLVEAAGLNLKQAAEKLDVPYPWLRRMATAGTSRADDRSRPYLVKITQFFALPEIDHLWRENLVAELLTSPRGEEFVRRFRETLERLYETESQKVSAVDQTRFDALRKFHGILGNVTPPQETTIREVVMAFLEDCRLPGLIPMAERWLKEKRKEAEAQQNATG